MLGHSHILHVFNLIQ